MSYQVIARKYRPQRFADVVGQEHVTQTLANAIAQSRIAHAYLFCGPRGTGKTTIARIFAKCLNCTGGPKVDFDEADPRCREITEGRAIDVLEIDGASNNGVEQVRELRDTVKYAPASSKFKIYIIDEVHMLTTAAFNALLKTLEEPPDHVKFMFATTDPEKVLPTILSRCQRFDLRRIPVSLITAHLGQIARQESVDIDVEALHAIARGADGGMRDAESALDQLISFCGPRIVESDVLSMFALTARSQVVALAGAVLRGEAEGALRELNELSRHGKDLGHLLSDLLGHLRNIMIFQVSQGDLRMLEVSEVEAASLKDQSAIVSNDTLTRIMEVMTEAEGRLRDAASKKIFIEVALLKAIQVRNTISLDEVLRQLQQLRAESGSASPRATPATVATVVPTPAPTRAPEPSRSSANPSSHAFAATPSATTPPAPPTSAAPPAASTDSTTTTDPAGGVVLDEEALTALWRDILEGVGRASPFTRNYLIEAHPVSLMRNVLTVGFDPEFAEHIDLVNNQKTHALLQTKLAEAGRPHTQLRFIKAERPIHWAAPTPRETVPAPAAAVETPGPATASGPAGASLPRHATATTPDPKASTAHAAAAARPEKPTPVRLSIEEFKNDPLIQKALEVFKGRIVEVRA